VMINGPCLPGVATMVPMLSQFLGITDMRERDKGNPRANTSLKKTRQTCCRHRIVPIRRVLM